MKDLENILASMQIEIRQLKNRLSFVTRELNVKNAGNINSSAHKIPIMGEKYYIDSNGDAYFNNLYFDGGGSSTVNFYNLGFDETIIAGGTHELITIPLPAAGYGTSITGWINICFVDTLLRQTTYYNRAHITHHLESGQYDEYINIVEMSPSELLAVGDVADKISMLIQPGVNYAPTVQTGYLQIKNNFVVDTEIFGSVNYGLMTVTL
jgi:hypothetical protein